MLNHADERFAAFRDRLKEGRPVFGLAVTGSGVSFAEIVAETGFDFAWIETEHTTLSLADIEHLIIALENRGCIPLVRVRRNEPNIIGQALDMGARIVNIPHVDTLEDARQAVTAAKYYPLGRRGYASTTRSTRQGFERLGLSAMEQRNAVTMLMVQIESAEAVANVDAIAATDGVDALFVGYADLCQDLGCDPDPKNPRCAESIRAVGEAAKRHGKYGAIIVSNPSDIPYYREIGFTIFLAGMDTRLFKAGAENVFKSCETYR